MKGKEEVILDPKIEGLRPIRGIRRSTGGWAKLSKEDRMYLAELLVMTNLSLESLSKIYDVTEMSLRGWLKKYCEVNCE